ncbi:MAG TPA: glycosyltransferase [Solirubrobacteraceae bacterium]|nr:glycosyltransferase [Solirubrobacteraceae bacterium]
MRLAIGIPTRNRRDLAMAAVESVVSSARREVAVVVSDNSTDDHDLEPLRELCARHDGVSYVRPPEPLAMPDHWEWLWHRIREAADPTHVAYLTDRMVFTPGALPDLLAIVERHPDRVLSYREDRIDDLTTPVQLVQSQWTGQLLELDPRRLIELSSRGDYGDHLPRMLNSIAPVEVVDAVEERFGDVFRTVSPDYGFAFRSLTVSGPILYLDRGCLIHYGMLRSAGISYLRARPNDAARDFERRLTSERFGATPEPRLETIGNAIYQEYCLAREQAGPEWFPPVDLESYLAVNAISATRMEDPEWRRRTEALLRERGWTRRRRAQRAAAHALRIASYFARHPTAFARSVKRQLWDRPPGTPAARLLPRLGIDPRIRDDLRFDDVRSAIAYAGAHPRRRTPYAWHLEPLRRGGAILSAAEPPEPAAAERPVRSPEGAAA